MSLREVDIRLSRVLVGDPVIVHKLLSDDLLQEHASSDKYLVYFELSLTSRAAAGVCRVSFEDFRLEDGGGLIYEPIRPRDALVADLAPGQTTRGGLVFAVYGDSAPARLLRRTGPEEFTPLPQTIFSRRRQ